MPFEHENPYLSPRHVDTGRLRDRPIRNGVSSQLQSKGLLYRRVSLEAPIEAILEFKGRSLRDLIVVDNEIVASKISWWRIARHFAFGLQVGDQILPVEVDLNVGLFLRLRGFRIRIDGATVYSEGRL
jgi:hypothetical protein